MPFDKTRVGKYEEIFANFVAHHKAGNLGDPKKKVASQEIVNALHEFGDFYYIWRGLESFDGEILRRKLAKAVTGSVMLVDEQARTSESRNTLFELTFGSMLPLSGIGILFRDPDDVVARPLGTAVLVECKRIQNAANFEKRFKKAVKQLVARLAREEDSRAKGLVAIDISKIINPGTVLPSSLSEGNTITGLKFAADKFCYEHIKFLGAFA